ncbi:MAG: DUF4129 domain-containing protein [Rhizobiaceae bacterium]
MTNYAPETARSGLPSLQTWLFVAMELSWIAAFLLLLDSGAGGGIGLSFALIALFYPLALLFDGGLQRLRPAQWQWIAGQAAAFVLLLALAFMALAPTAGPDWREAGFHPGWLIEDAGGRHGLILVAGALFCWVRGLMLSGKRLSADAVALGFQIGLLVLLLVLAIGQGLDQDQGVLVWLGLAFVGFGLAALWHVRASAGGTGAGGSRRNPMSAVAGIAAVLVVGLLASAIVDRSVLDIVLALLMRGLETAGAFIAWLFNFLPEPEPEAFEMPKPQGGGAIPSEPREPMLRGPDWLRRIFSTLFFGTIAIVLAIILLGNLRGLIAWLRKPRRLTQGLDFDRSSHGLGDTLRQLWSALTGILSSVGAALAASVARLGRRQRTTQHSRRTYLRLLRDLENRGWPRERHETPSDYARRMRGVWPGPGGDLALAGKLYDAQRYGDADDRPEGRFAKLRRKLRRSLNLVRYKEHDPYAQDGKRD